MTKETENPLKTYVTIAVSFLTGVTILISILGWKIDNSINNQIQASEKETEMVYLRKDVFVEYQQNINAQLSAIVRAVGATVRRTDYKEIN